MSKIMLLLPNGFEAIEAGVFTDIMGWNMMVGDRSTELITVGLHPVINSTWNLQVCPELQLRDANLDKFDALVIPGGFEESYLYDDIFRTEVFGVIDHFKENNKIIITVAVFYGKVPFERANVIKDKSITAYIQPTNINFGKLNEFRDNLAQQNKDKIESDIIVAVNPGTAFEAAFLLLEKLTSCENVKHIKNMMGFSE